MEAHELRRMRQAHRLTPQQLADILDVSIDQVARWELPAESDGHEAISAPMRKLVLRELALQRDREEQRYEMSRPHVFPAGFEPVMLRVGIDS